MNQALNPRATTSPQFQVAEGDSEQHPKEFGHPLESIHARACPANQQLISKECWDVADANHRGVV
jgi:hypothetical protein